ncbi:MAG: hypothetical protein DRP74_06520 [Candidatus Omnitrophota bacterium]|nr:MAG: hypothetical protein DRP74_06520 [Candidatus Omnitrophota bacterium]
MKVKSQDQIQKLVRRVIKQISPFLREISQLGSIFYRQADVLTDDQFKVFETKLTGIYTFLNTQKHKISCLCYLEELNYFKHLRDQALIRQQEFSPTLATKQSKLYVYLLAKLESRLKGAVENLQEMIQTCRQRAYFSRKERNLVQ